MFKYAVHIVTAVLQNSRLKGPDFEEDHTPPSTENFMNERSWTYTPILIHFITNRIFDEEIKTRLSNAAM